MHEALQQRQAQLRLLESQQQAERVETDNYFWNFENSPEGRALVSPEGVLLLVNTRASQFLEHSQAELKNADLVQFLDPSVREETKARILACSQNQQPGVWKVRLADTVRELRLQGWCLNMGQKPAVQLAMLEVFATNRSWGVELEVVLDKIPEGVLLADPEGLVVFQNQKALELVGSSLMGQRLSRLGSWRDQLSIKRLGDRFLARVCPPQAPRLVESELEEIRERERLTLARQFQNDLSQTLISLADLTSSLSGCLASCEREWSELLNRLAQQCRLKTRVFERGLYPPELGRHGLLGALRELADTTEEYFGVRCQAHGQPVDLDGSRALHLYRTAQEAVTNAVKHAAARQIDLFVQEDQHRVWLEVQDDGQGIGPAGPRSRGLGLRSMRKHADLIEGGLEVLTRPGGGTRIRCWAPRFREGGEPSR
ncbi:MAG: ATP-binding protein [Vulcanimicrobiota bacterium]